MKKWVVVFHRKTKGRLTVSPVFASNISAAVREAKVELKRRHYGKIDITGIDVKLFEALHRNPKPSAKARYFRVYALAVAADKVYDRELRRQFGAQVGMARYIPDYKKRYDTKTKIAELRFLRAAESLRRALKEMRK